MSRAGALVVNGWTLFAHPLFLDEIEALIAEVELLKKKQPDTYTTKNPSKRLAAINKLAFEVIPIDPEDSAYRQGGTLGKNNRHWFRANFFQQYRLFFRFDTRSKIIVYAWVNDEKNKRAYGDKNDAYSVFGKMLEKGRPPDSWKTLLDEAKKARRRFHKALDKSDA